MTPAAVARLFEAHLIVADLDEISVSIGQLQEAVRAIGKSVEDSAQSRARIYDELRKTRDDIQIVSRDVLLLTGRALSTWQRESTAPVVAGRFRVVALRREPADRQRRVVERVERMLAEGLVDEVRGLLERAPFAPEPARAIG